MIFRRYGNYDEKTLFEGVKSNLESMKGLFKNAVEFCSLKIPNFSMELLQDVFVSDCTYIAGCIAMSDGVVTERELEMAKELFGRKIKISDRSFNTKEIVRDIAPNALTEVWSNKWAPSSLKIILVAESYIMKDKDNLYNAMSNLIEVILLVSVLLAGADGERDILEDTSLRDIANNSVELIRESGYPDFCLKKEHENFVFEVFNRLPLKS